MGIHVKYLICKLWLAILTFVGIITLVKSRVFFNLPFKNFISLLQTCFIIICSIKFTFSGFMTQQDQEQL